MPLSFIQCSCTYDSPPCQPFPQLTQRQEHLHWLHTSCANHVRIHVRIHVRTMPNKSCPAALRTCSILRSPHVANTCNPNAGRRIRRLCIASQLQVVSCLTCNMHRLSTAGGFMFNVLVRYNMHRLSTVSCLKQWTKRGRLASYRNLYGTTCKLTKPARYNLPGLFVVW